MFDPDLTGQTGVQKIVSPTTSSLQTGGAESFVQKEYVWNFAINKTLATTNGTLGVTFTNNYFSTNSAFASVNPAYTPALDAFAQPAVAAQLRQPVRHHQRAHRRVKPEAGAVQLRAAA